MTADFFFGFFASSFGGGASNSSTNTCIASGLGLFFIDATRSRMYTVFRPWRAVPAAASLTQRSAKNCVVFAIAKCASFDVLSTSLFSFMSRATREMGSSSVASSSTSSE